MDMKDLISFEKAAEDVTEVVATFYTKCMALNKEDTIKFQDYIKTMPKEDVLLFTDEFEIIKKSICRLDQLMTSIIGDELKDYKMHQNSTNEEIIDFYNQILEMCKKDKEKVKECMDDFVKDDLQLKLQLFTDERLENENLFKQN